MGINKLEITGLFPGRMRRMLEDISLDFDQLEEVRLRCGQPVLLRVCGREMGIDENGKLVDLCEGLFKQDKWKKLENINEKELKDTLEIMGGFSLYAAEEELRQGFFTVRGGHRIGVAGRVILKDQKIMGIKSAAFLNLRVAHDKRLC